MRFVPSDYLESTLQRGKSLEQFLGRLMRDGQQCIRWIELRPENESVEIWDFVAPDFGDQNHLDLYEFIGDDFDRFLVAAVGVAARGLGIRSQMPAGAS